jgi:hypothetical protein
VEAMWDGQIEGYSGHVHDSDEVRATRSINRANAPDRCTSPRRSAAAVLLLAINDGPDDFSHHLAMSLAWQQGRRMPGTPRQFVADRNLVGISLTVAIVHRARC